MIKVEGLTKRYARTVAVDNISFDLFRRRVACDGNYTLCDCVSRQFSTIEAPLRTAPKNAGSSTTLEPVVSALRSRLQSPLSLCVDVHVLPENPDRLERTIMDWIGLGNVHHKYP